MEIYLQLRPSSPIKAQAYIQTDEGTVELRFDFYSPSRQKPISIAPNAFTNAWLPDADLDSSMGCRTSSRARVDSRSARAAGRPLRACARADQVLKRDRYVAKTTTATARQATTYSVEVSPVALLLADSRAKMKPLTIIRIADTP
jgi:hypothetical protein